MHVGLCHTEFAIAVSCAFMVLSEQFNTDSQCPLMGLNGFGVVMHFVLCYTESPVAVAVLSCSSPNSLILIANAHK